MGGASFASLRLSLSLMSLCHILYRFTTWLQAMSQDTMTMLIPRYGMIIKLDDNGSIIESLQDPSGAVMDEITDVFQDQTDNAIYLGSYKHKFLGKLKLS